MSRTQTLIQTHEEVLEDTPWCVIVHDDPVNLMDYVTWVLCKVFAYPQAKAAQLMRQVHRQGKATVWLGDREKAEFYLQQLQLHQLQTSIEKAP